MSNHQRTFIVDKIRTSEICGVDGGSVTICGVATSNNSIETLSGRLITGENLVISGSTAGSLINMESGVYDSIKTQEILVDGTGNFTDLVINGVKYIPKNTIAYAFYFGGPQVRVPARLPHVTGSSPNLFTGLASGQNAVFVESSSSFSSGDHIVINAGGAWSDGSPQEEHTVSSVEYHKPDGCCNAIVTGTRPVGQTRVYHPDENNSGWNFQAGDVLRIGEDITPYTVSSTDVDSSTTRYVDVSPALVNSADNGECICLVQPTLITQENLKNNYPSTNTFVHNKNSALLEGGTSSCSTNCYDTKYLYLEQGVYTGNFDWYLSQYREYFIDASGVDVHITGKSTSGILTLKYPNIL